MRRAQGYAVWTGADGAPVERDTITCAHCNNVEVVAPGADPGGFCRMCMKPLCSRCANDGRCLPFERRLEQMERRERLLDAARGR